MRGRTVASGAGAREPIVGTGTDDTTDALDRRVEIKPAPADNCAT
jgi:outer membrane protein OmpA-like peptidoglycan-associated protein